MCTTLLNASSSRSLSLVWGVGRMVVRRPKEVERSGFGIPFPIIGILLLLLHPLPGGGDGRVQSGALERTKKKKKVSQEGERTQIRPRPRERDGGGEENKALFGVVYRENAMEYGWQRDVGKKRLRAPRCTHSASASLWAPHEKGGGGALIWREPPPPICRKYKQHPSACFCS